MESNESASKLKARSQKNKRKDRPAVKLIKQKEDHQLNCKKSASNNNNCGDGYVFSGDDDDEEGEKRKAQQTIGKKPKEPVFEEDVIDGFAFISFKTYEDLQNTIRECIEKNGEVEDIKERVNNHHSNGILNSKNCDNINGEALKVRQKILINNNNNTPNKRIKKVGLKNKKNTSPDKVNNNLGPNNVFGAKIESIGNSLNNNSISNSLTSRKSATTATTASSATSVSPPKTTTATTASDDGWTRLANGPVRSNSREPFSDTSSRASSGRGYMCDSESEDDRVSDASFDGISSSLKLNHVGGSRCITPVTSTPTVAVSQSSSNCSSSPPPVQLPTLYPPGSVTHTSESKTHTDSSGSNRHRSNTQSSCSNSSPSSNSSFSPPPPLLVANSHIRHRNPSSADHKCPPALTPPFISTISPNTSTVSSLALSSVPATSPALSSTSTTPSSRSNSVDVHKNWSLSPEVTTTSSRTSTTTTTTPSSPSLVNYRTTSGSVGNSATNCKSSSSSTPISGSSCHAHPALSPQTPSLSTPSSTPSPFLTSLSSSSSTVPVTCPASTTTSKARSTPSCTHSSHHNHSTTVTHSKIATSSTRLTSQSNRPSSSSAISSSNSSVSSTVRSSSVAPAPSSSPRTGGHYPLAFPSSTQSPSPLLPPVSSVGAGHHGMFVHPPANIHPPPPTSVPATPSRESLFSPSNQQDLLRRELDSRFLASHDRSVNVPPPPYMRTEMHQHQHQHTHLHQHNHHLIPQQPPSTVPPVNPHSSPSAAPTNNAPPPVVPSPSGASGAVAAALGGSLLPQSSPHMFDKFSKLDSPFHRPGLGISPYPGLSPLLAPGNPASSATPFNTPNQMAAFQPKLPAVEKSKSVKSGKWNAMHVRIAWEIYNHQQKQQPDSQKSGLIGKSSDPLLRPPSHLFPAMHSHPMDIPPFSASALLNAASGHTRNPFDGTPHPGLFMSPNNSPLGMTSFPRPSFPLGMPGNNSFGGLGAMGSGLLGNGNREMAGFPSGVDQWNRLLRTPSSFPTPPPHSWHMKNSETPGSAAERDRLHREEQERDKGRDHLRKPTPNAIIALDKERKDLNRSKESGDREREKQKERDRENRPTHSIGNSLSNDHYHKDYQRNGLSESTSHERQHRDREIRERSRDTSRSPLRNNVFRDSDPMIKSHPLPSAPVKSDSAFDTTKKISSNASVNGECKIPSATVGATKYGSMPVKAPDVHKVKQERKDDDITVFMPQKNESHGSSASIPSDVSTSSEVPMNRAHHDVSHSRVTSEHSSRPVMNISSSSAASSMNLINMYDRARMLGPLGLRLPPPHGINPAAAIDRPHSLALWDLYRSSLEYNPMQLPGEREQHERELMHRFGNPLAASAVNPMMLPHAVFPPRFRQEMDSAAIMRELERQAVLERSKQLPPSLRTTDPAYLGSTMLPPRNAANSPLLNSLGGKSNSPLANSLTMGGGPPPLIPSGGQNHSNHRPSPINNLLQKYSNSPGMLENSVKEAKKDANGLPNYELEHQSR